MADSLTRVVKPAAGSVKPGPERWLCGCGVSTFWDRDNGVVPTNWVKMSLWIGGAGEFGLTKMEEKVMCPQCAWASGVVPHPSVAPTNLKRLPPLRMLPPRKK